MFSWKLFFSIELILSAIKLYILFYFFTNLGFLYGILIFTILNYSKRILFEKIFNLEQLSASDKVFLTTKVFQMPIISSISFFENFDEEKIKNIIIERAIKKLKKFRMRIVYKFFNYSTYFSKS